MKKKVLITGGTGLIGSHLTKLLLQKGYAVGILTRNPEKHRGQAIAYKWDIPKGFIDPEAFTDTTFIIHLAGADVADQRWTAPRKEEILKSRTESAKLLYDWLAKNEHDVEAFLSPSGINYYKQNTDEVLTEASEAGNDFLADVTKAWEKSADEIKSLGIRTVKLRIGIVLSDKGGALVELAKPVKLGAAAPLGSGEQFMSWIHINDLCNIFLYAMENITIEGVYNAVAPNPVSNREFTEETARILKKPSFLPAVPAFALQLILGERASIILDGAKVSSEKIIEKGFSFEYPNLAPALEVLFKVKGKNI